MQSNLQMRMQAEVIHPRSKTIKVELLYQTYMVCFCRLFFFHSSHLIGKPSSISISIVLYSADECMADTGAQSVLFSQL